jgi:hypothetical protein
MLVNVVVMIIVRAINGANLHDPILNCGV